MAKQKYFSHDSNARNDEKIVNMRMQMGAEGYAIYFMILERLRESEDFMGVKDYNVIAFDLRVDAKDVKRVVEDFGLFQFTDDGKQFYSDSFRDRMRIMESKRIKQVEAGKRTASMRWSGSKSEGDGVTNLSEKSNSTIGNLSGKSNSPIANLSEMSNLPIGSSEKEKERTKEKDKDRKTKTKKVVESPSKEEDSMSDTPNGVTDASSSSSPSLFGDEVPEKEKSQEIDYTEIIKYWNTTTNGVFGSLKSIDNQRRTWTRARIREYGIEAFYQAIRNAAASEFLRGASWFSYDWMVRPNNFVKVLEDKYGKKERTDSSGGSGREMSEMDAANSIRMDGEQGRNVKPVRKRVYE